MQSLVCQQTQLELNALRYGKPMKAVPQHVLDMILLLGADIINPAAVFITDCSRSS